MVITGRTKHFINAFGEELIIDNAEKALKTAAGRTNASIKEFTAAPVYMSETNEKGSHQWLIEFEKQPDDMELFTEALDTALKSLNSDYEAKRHKNTTLNKPEIINVSKGVFYRWMEQRGKLGGQHKVPRLANNRKYADELLKLNEAMKK